MHQLSRLIKAFFLTVASIILLFSAAFVYLIVTPLGGKLLVKYFKQDFLSVGLMHVGHYEGSLQNGFTLKDINIRGLAYFPNALLRIQEIHVRLPLWDISHSDFSIFNARIFMPNSDPFVFTGRVFQGQVQGNLYSKSVDIHEASRYWTNEDMRKNLKGIVSNVDLQIQGPLSSPRINGSFVLDTVRYRSVLLTKAVAKMDLVCFPYFRQFQIKGEVLFNSGSVDVRSTDLQLTPSKIVFKGEALNPLLDIRLVAKLEDIDIHLAVKGTLINPGLIVSSDPPMAPQDALQVLFTGNAWTSSTSPFNGVTSGELAQNFLNYSLQDKDDQQRLGLKTKLTENLKLGVAMDQKPSPVGDTAVSYSRKIEGEMDVSDHMSLNVSQEVLSQNRGASPSSTYTQSQPETQVYVQYKKRF